MTKEVIEVPVVQEGPEDQAAPVVVGELRIKLLDNGALDLEVPEGSKEFTPDEIEKLTEVVYRQLYEQRIARLAVEIFKTRLG